MKRFDERDVIFARLLYSPQTSAYMDYYKKNPVQKEADDAFRAKPPLGDASAVFYDLINSPMSDGCFDFLGVLKGLVETS